MSEQESGTATSSRTLMRNSLGMCQFLHDAKKWDWTDSEIAAVLGTSITRLHEWRSAANRHDLQVDDDIVRKLSALLGIHAALVTLLPTLSNQALWWRAANSGEPAAGRSPLAFLIEEESRGALLALRNQLDRFAA